MGSLCFRCRSRHKGRRPIGDGPCAVNLRKPLTNYGGPSATRSTRTGRSSTTCAVRGRNGTPSISGVVTAAPSNADVIPRSFEDFAPGVVAEVAKFRLTMNAERNNDPALRPQLCPRCAQPMRPARSTKQFGGLPELMTLECELCGLSNTEEHARPRKVSPGTNISAWYLDEFGNPTRENKARRVGACVS
jgi:hypothetical protein